MLAQRRRKRATLEGPVVVTQEELLREVRGVCVCDMRVCCWAIELLSTNPKHKTPGAGPAGLHRAAARKGPPLAPVPRRHAPPHHHHPPSRLPGPRRRLRASRGPGRRRIVLPGAAPLGAGAAPEGGGGGGEGGPEDCGAGGSVVAVAGALGLAGAVPGGAAGAMGEEKIRGVGFIRFRATRTQHNRTQHRALWTRRPWRSSSFTRCPPPPHPHSLSLQGQSRRKRTRTRRSGSSGGCCGTCWGDSSASTFSCCSCCGCVRGRLLYFVC